MKQNDDQDSRNTEKPSTCSSELPKRDGEFYSIVSKRSVEKVYYPRDPSFFKPFVPKFKRRAPLINRGYWLRMKAVDNAIENFLRRTTDRKRVVVNLGCGYDPLPFRVHFKGLAHEGVKFVDVDYREVILTKVKLMTDDKHLRTFLDSWNYSTTEDGDVVLTSDYYAIVGCAFNDIVCLNHLFSQTIPLQGCKTLLIVEDSFMHMETCEAIAIIKWAAGFENVQFCLLEQCLLDTEESNHPFVEAMKRSITSRGSENPILYRNEHRDRFHNAGWSLVDVQSLWDIWQDPDALKQEELLALHKSEPFDDWEDFVLFASHQLILQASTSDPALADEPMPTIEVKDESQSEMHDISRPSTFSNSLPRASQARRFAAPLVLSADSVVLHGGTPSTRDCELYTSNCRTIAEFPANIPQSLFHHTITAFSPIEHLLVGGRSSPTQVSSQCLVYNTSTNQWNRVHDIAPERYRNSSVSVCVDERKCVLVFGGRDRHGIALGDWQLWNASHGWRTLKCSNRLLSRFGSAMITTDDTKGIILGGMNETGRVLEDAFEWTINDQLEVVCTPICLTGSKTAARFGATLVSSRWGNLLVGGVSSKGVIPKQEDILVIENNGATRPLDPMFSKDSPRPVLIAASVTTVLGGDILILGGGTTCFSHGTIMNDSWYMIQDTQPISDVSQNGSEVLPFSQFRRITKDDLDTSNTSSAGAVLRDFRASHEERTSEAEYQELKLTEGPPHRPESTFSAARNFLQNCPAIKKVPSQTISNTTDLFALLLNPQPVNFLLPEPLSSQPVPKWTLDHLTTKIGRTTKVSIHDSHGPHMKFAGPGRNITYTTTPFGHFATLLAHGHHCYLRALSASQSFDRPADFWRDFPGLAADFTVPDMLRAKFGISEETLHSAVLRVSGDVTMWVHYDVMSNLLFQLAGAKQILLFPPPAVLKLGFAPGKTASPLNVFEELERRGLGTDAASLESPTALDFLNGATAYSVVLEPGSALYIPRFWAHATAPDGPGAVSVAVNVFWRDLGTQAYSLKKDVYGSLDLKCYEMGRPKVQKAAVLLCEKGRQDEYLVISRFLRTGEAGGDRKPDLRSIGLDGFRESVRAGVPEDVSDFYLLRLADEFERLVSEDIQHRFACRE